MSVIGLVIPSSPEPAALRVRATGLRTVARALHTSPIVDLHLRAGTDVWIGPTASGCQADLVAMGRRVTGAADELVRRARRLEQQADVLEAMTAVAG
jgi:hypothetical protein